MDVQNEKRGENLFFWTKHDEAEGGRMGEQKKTTLDEAVEPNAGATER